MNVSVLYLQANEQVARTIKGRFDEGQIEFLIVSTAKEAFAIYEERVVTLTLVDANIPDMKIGDFLLLCQRQYPDMILNVCMDVKESSHLVALTANPSVVKIFIPPLDIDTIVEGVEDSIDASQIGNDFAKRRRELEKEEAEFAATLERLKSSLIRQKYSYNRIEPLLNSALNAFISMTDTDSQLAEFIKKTCNKMLVLETAMSLKCGELNKIIESSILEISKLIKIKQVDSCLMGDIPKSILADVITGIYMTTGLENNRSDNLVVSVDSEYKTSTKVQFRVEYEGSFSASSEERQQLYVERILANIMDEFEYIEENDKHIWELSVQLH